MDGGCSIKLNSPFSLGALACLAGAIAQWGPFSLREATRASWAELRPSDSERERPGGQDPEVPVRRTRRPTVTPSQRRLGVNGTMTPLNLETGSDPSDRIQAAGRSLAGQVRFLSYATVRLHERLRVPGHRSGQVRYITQVRSGQVRYITQARPKSEATRVTRHCGSFGCPGLRGIDGLVSSSSRIDRCVVSVYFAESKFKTLAPSLTRRRSRKLEPTQLKPAQPPTASHCHLPQPASASHSFPLPPPTASSHLGPHSSPERPSRG